MDKGIDIKRYRNRDIKNIEEYMNNYPRKMFGGLSSNKVYDILYNTHWILTFRVAIYKYYWYNSSLSHLTVYVIRRKNGI